MKDHFGKSTSQGAWALVLALVLPFAARAANEGEIHNYILSINRLYESLDYERALSRIQLGRQLPRGTDEEVTLSLYEGIILCEMGRPGPGTAAFRDALMLRPDAKLPVQVAPKLEALFAEVRAQVNQELASRLPQRGTESPPDKPEQNQEVALAPPTPTPAQEKREETNLAQPSKQEAPSSAVESKAAPVTQATSAPKVAQKKEEPAAVQPVAQPDCRPEPTPSGQSRKERQLSRLIQMKHTLCLSGKFQGLAVEEWMGLRDRMEEATTSHEWMLITQGIDQFSSEFIYEEPRRKAEQQEARRLKEEGVERLEAKRLEEARRLEAERLQAERQEWERQEAERAQMKKKARDDANLDTSSCQPAISADCEMLLKRLRSIQEAFLRTNPSSRLVSLRILSLMGQEIRAARTHEQLGEAAQALEDWEQRQLPH